jgi:enoyl-CoA hydratase
MPLHIRAARPHVTLITIDNPAKRNAMPRDMLAELADAWDRLEADRDCRCIILTGAGDKAFCAGADIGGDLSASVETAAIINRALQKTKVFSKPIIAAVNGDAAGGGLELLLATDIRAAAPRARFGLPEVRWSIYPFGGSTVKLLAQIGYVHAMDLLLTGRLIDAASAANIGLINRVVADDELMPWAVETAAMIAENSPSAVQAVKLQISATLADHALTREPLEQELGDKVRAGPHFAEGVAAFREKRRPRYE